MNKKLNIKKKKMNFNFANHKNPHLKVFKKMIWIYTLCTLVTMLLITGFSLKTIGLTIIVSSFFITLNAMGYYMMLNHSRLNEIIRNQQEILIKLNEPSFSFYDDDDDDDDDFKFSKN